MKKENEFVAMIHELCIICGAKVNESIAIHKRLGDLSKINGQATGFADHPCDECKKGIDMGAIMVIVIDENKTTDMHDPKTWFRTGHVFGFKKQAIQKWITDTEKYKDVEKFGFMVVDYKLAKNAGMPVQYEP